MGNKKWGSRALVVGALVAGACVGVGVSNASSPAHTPSVAPSVDVAFTPVAPQKQVFGGSVGAFATKLVTVSGGTTTVPTNATTVQLLIGVKGAKDGTLSFYPAGNQAGSSGQTVTVQAGVRTGGIITTDIGLKNQIAVVNNSAGAATVTVIAAGYSTDVEVDDISSQGGTTGQVLTDTGTGAAWQAPQLPPAYFAKNQANVHLSSNYTDVVTLTVPAGTYAVSAQTGLYGSGTNGNIACTVFAPNQGLLGQQFAMVDASVTEANLSIQGLLQTGGGTVRLQCYTLIGNINTQQSTLLATRVGTTSGPIVSRPSH